jgi:hypothetical protein
MRKMKKPSLAALVPNFSGLAIADGRPSRTPCDSVIYVFGLQ